MFESLSKSIGILLICFRPSILFLLPFKSWGVGGKFGANPVLTQRKLGEKKGEQIELQRKVKFE